MSNDLPPFAVPLEELIRHPVGIFVNGASGSGKSTLIRHIAESTHGRIQQIFFDSEGEFWTLREKFEYILIGTGPGADIPARVDTAAKFAAALMQSGVSAVIDISGLKTPDQQEYVTLFIEQLMETPIEQWHPVLVFLDELRRFAPQSKKSRSFAALADLQARGRKRGFVPVYATQSYEGVDKDAISEMDNRITGKIAVDIRRKRAADDLGLNATDGALLQTLQPGQFFVKGPAFGDVPRRVQVPMTVTRNPPAGSAATPPSSTSEAMERFLTLFAAAAADAVSDGSRDDEEDPATLDDAVRRVRSLKKRVSELQSAGGVQKVVEAVPALSEADLARLEGIADRLHESVDDLVAHADIQREQIAIQQQQVDALLEQAKGVAATADQIRAAVRHARGGCETAPPFALSESPETTEREPVGTPADPSLTAAPDAFDNSAVNRSVDTAGNSDAPVATPIVPSLMQEEIRMLSALAEYPGNRLSIIQMEMLSGVPYGNPRSLWGTATANLQELGLLKTFNGSYFVMTPQGKSTLEAIQGKPVTTRTAAAIWNGRLRPKARQMLLWLMEIRPRAVTKAALARRHGLEPGKDGIRLYLKELQSMDLIVETGAGEVRIADNVP